MFSAAPRRLLPGSYRSLFADRRFRRMLPVFALSDLGDGMTVVAVAWMALALGGQGALIGIAVAAYILPGAFGALALGRWMRRLPARRLLITDSTLRAGLLGAIPLTHVTGVLTPAVYVGLLAASSLLHAWGMLPFAYTGSAAPSLIGFAFAGLVYGPYSALSFTVLQDRAPAGALTSVLAARSAVLLTASPLGAASGGFLVDRTGAPAILAGCGGLMILIAAGSAIARLSGDGRR